MWQFQVPHISGLIGSSRLIHVVAFLRIPFLFKTIIFSCMHRSHFVYPFIQWWTFECFYLLAIVDNTNMNMNIQIHVKLPMCNVGGTYPEVELMDHSVIIRLLFWGAAVLFSSVAASFDLPTRNAQGSNVPTSWPLPVMFCFSFCFVLLLWTS